MKTKILNWIYGINFDLPNFEESMHLRIFGFELIFELFSVLFKEADDWS